MSLPVMHPLPPSPPASRGGRAREDHADEASGRYRLVARFGGAVMGEGFTAIPNQVLNHYAMLGSAGGEVLSIVHVCQSWWSEAEQPRPSPGMLARQMGVDERTIRNYTASLEAKGFLTIRRRWQPGASAPTYAYDFTPLLEVVARVASGDSSSLPSIDPRPRAAAVRGRRKNVSAQRLKPFAGPRGKDVSVIEDEGKDLTL